MTRRSYVRTALAGSAQFFCAAEESQDGKVGGSARSPCLVREFERAQLLAMSPTGEWICLHQGSGIRRWGQTRSGWFERTEKTPAGIVILRFPSLQLEWSRSSSSSLREYASFFSDGRRLFGERFAAAYSDQRTILDISSRVEKEYTMQREKGVSRLSFAYSDDVLLVYEQVLAVELNGFRSSWLRQNSSTGEELDRVGYAPDGALLDRGRGEAIPCVSLDREVIVHVFEGRIVMRLSKDLTVRWVRPPEPEFTPRRLGISAGGELVAVAMCDNTKLSSDARQRKFILILNGRDGSVVRRIPVDGSASVAVSRDGSLIAAGAVLEDVPRRGMLRTVVRLFDGGQGAEPKLLTHSEVSVQNRLASGLGWTGLQFTPDDQFLISSGESTRIWKLDGRCK